MFNNCDGLTSVTIPENITTNESLKTAIRIKASIATPTAYFTNEEINDIIDLAIKNNNYDIDKWYKKQAKKIFQERLDYQYNKYNNFKNNKYNLI